MTSIKPSLSVLILSVIFCLNSAYARSFRMNQEINHHFTEEIRPGYELEIYHHGTDSDKFIFFIHGAGGRADQWHHQINALKDKYTIVAFDLLGHGKSPKPKAGYTFSELMGDVEKIYTKYKRENNIVIAHSYGVAFALQLALKNEHKIQKLILIGANKPRSITRVGLWNLPVFILEWLRPVFSNGFAKNAFHSDSDPDFINRERVTSDQNPMGVMKALMKGMKEIPSMNVNDITIPVLIINGETDGLTPVEGAKLLAAEIPHAELKIIERAAHLVMMEQPEIVNKIIANFINQ
jgi:abhydrolase domain-containing protein 8